MRQLPLAHRIVGGLLVVMVLPLVLVMAAALFGAGAGSTPHFSSWLMGSLTCAGAIALLASIEDCLRNHYLDWFWLFITGSATLFWGSVFVHSLA